VKFSSKGRVNVWYADVIDHIEYDEDGVAAFLDMYLDVIFSPKGDLKVDDLDELEGALADGDVTAEQYELAIAEGESIRRAYCRNVRATEAWCRCLLEAARQRFDAADTLRRNG
jgi:predicted RNA-binding protein associated with RNAse of E/G family